MNQEFERWVDPIEMARAERPVIIEANADERKALCARFGLLSMDQLKVTIAIVKGEEKGTYVMNGHMVADVVQACVTSLKPVPAHVDEGFEVILVPQGYAVPDDEDDDWAEDYEFMSEQGVDAGEIAAQYLFISLDPFPRAEGGSVADLDAKNVVVLTEEEALQQANPFNVLKNIKESG